LRKLLDDRLPAVGESKVHECEAIHVKPDVRRRREEFPTESHDRCGNLARDREDRKAVAGEER
jgi:hypothetical protein